MEVQDFAPHFLLAQLVFKTTTPAIVDHRGAWVATLRDEFGATEAEVEPAAVEAFSEDKREQYRVGTAQVVASIENFEEIDAAGEKIARFAKLALERIDETKVAQIRVRTFDLAATDSFGELRDALADALTAPGAELADLGGSGLSDVGWVFEFTDGNPKITLRLGPMRASQIKEFLRDQRDSQYPGEFLFVDVDYVHAGEDLSPEQAVMRLTQDIEGNRKAVRRVSNWLMRKVAP